MIKPVVLFVCPLLFVLGLAQQGQSIAVRGSISGIAFDLNGHPAKGVILTAYPLGVGLGAILPTTKTNDFGAFRFDDIPWWGRFTVFADDEEAGYSQFSTGPSDYNAPSVTIDIDHPEAKLDVFLPRKAGFLYINLTNRRTGLPISSMHVHLMKASEPTKFLFSTSCFSNHVVLIPPDDDLLVHVTSEGFKEWSQSIGKGKLLRLSSGARQTLIVELEPSP